jgi:hypothetical protein
MAGDTVSEETNKKEYTLDEIAKHTSHDDCWLIVGNQSNGTSCYGIIYMCRAFISIEIHLDALIKMSSR